jgi:hypothetical protein
MCFYLPRNAKPLVADKDIECWKTVSHGTNGRYISVVQGYIYEGGKINREVYLTPRPGLNLSVINNGYHSYIARRAGIDQRTFTKCWIPKGSTYYVNTGRNEYVSSNIVVGIGQTQRHDNLMRTKQWLHQHNNNFIVALMTKHNLSYTLASAYVTIAVDAFTKEIEAELAIEKERAESEFKVPERPAVYPGPVPMTFDYSRTKGNLPLI